jgi:uncharacterized tellurite resistance protein B-like protein
MNMEFGELDDSQRRALLDLVILVMYADGNLTTAEDERLERLLVSLGCTDAYDRQQRLDDSVTRMRRFTEKQDAALTQVSVLLQAFPEREQGRRIHALLEGFITSDGHVTGRESRLLEFVRSNYQL